MANLKKITRTVLSYCEIPENIANSTTSLDQCGTDVYIEYRIPRDDEDYDLLELDKWIMKEHPELKGQTILIHIDY